MADPHFKQSRLPGIAWRTMTLTYNASQSTDPIPRVLAALRALVGFPSGPT